MKFIYTTDIHGDINKYETLPNIAKSENIKYIVIGGDILPNITIDFSSNLALYRNILKIIF